RLLVIHDDDPAALVQPEPEPAPAHDQLHADPVPPPVDARRAPALGGEQPQLLVVAHRAVHDPELLGDLGDRPGLGVGTCHGHRSCFTLTSTSSTPRGEAGRRCSSSPRTTRTSAPSSATSPRRRSPPTSRSGTGTSTSRPNSSPRWASSGCSGSTPPRSTAAPASTRAASPTCAWRSRSWAGSTSPSASPCPRASAWASTRS